HASATSNSVAIDSLAFNGERLFVLYWEFAAGDSEPSPTQLGFTVSECVLYRTVAREQRNAGARAALPVACAETDPVFFANATWEPGMLSDIPERLGTLIDAARFLSGEGALDCREALRDGSRAAMYGCVEDAFESGNPVFSVSLEGGTDSLLYYGFSSDGVTHYYLFADTYNCFGLGGSSACFSVRQCVGPIIRSSGVTCGQYELLLFIESPSPISAVVEQLQKLEAMIGEG
ncbi:MAG: hypothetical protein KDI09_03970, partial [Halioglobus sp.]|nr:hypothetical protein [Halioglobus sp.]